MTISVPDGQQWLGVKRKHGCQVVGDLEPAIGCRSLYGQCIFSQKTSANTALSDELLAATRSPQFAANALLLQPSFNATILPYETEYFATTTAGAARLKCHLACPLP